MGSVGRAIGTLGLTVAGSLLGPAGFATYGAAIGSFVGGVLFSPRGAAAGFRLDSLDIETYDYGFARPWFFGTMRTTGTVIDGRYVDGVAKCLEEKVSVKKKGGIFGIGGTKVTTYSYFLSASYLWGKGPLFVDKLWFEDATEKRLIYNRDGETDDDKGYVLTPQLDEAGQIVAELSDGLDLFHGYESQPVSTYLQSQHPDGVPAYRGTAYTNLKGFELKNGQGKLIALVRNPENGRRQIIERALSESIPPGRLSLTGMEQTLSAHESGGGAVLSGTDKISDFVSQIALLGLQDIAHVDGLLVNRSRVAPLYHVLQLDELGAAEWNEMGSEAGDFVKIQPVNVTELPSSLRLEFQDINLNYESNWVRSIRETATHTNEMTLSLPIATTLQEMQWLCDTLLDEYWAARASVEVSLLPRRLPVAVGDVLLVPDDGGVVPVFHIMRVTEQSVSPDGLVACKGNLYDGGVYGQFRPVENVVLPQPAVTVYEAPLYGLFDIPAVDDGTAGEAGFLVAAAPPAGTGWAGAFFVPLLDEPLAIDTVATLGFVTDEVTFSPDATTRLEDATIGIYLHAGTVAPTTLEKLRDQGANTLAINTPAGVCVLQFQDAVATDSNGHYEISGILAGRFGSDYALAIPADSPCVLLKDQDGRAAEGLNWFSLSDAQVGIPLSYQLEAGDAQARSDGLHTWTPTGNSLMPLSPAHVALESIDDGHRLFWQERTRLQPGASWTLTRPGDPSNFVVRLLDGDTVKLSRTVTGNHETVVLNSELTAAYGSVPATLSGDVAQISERVGTGHPRAFSFDLE